MSAFKHLYLNTIKYLHGLVILGFRILFLCKIKICSESKILKSTKNNDTHKKKIIIL